MFVNYFSLSIIFSFYSFFLGCIYGKGNQYAGTANVSESGKDCLPWSDPRIAHSLAIHVSFYVRYTYSHDILYFSTLLHLNLRNKKRFF